MGCRRRLQGCAPLQQPEHSPPERPWLPPPNATADLAEHADSATFDALVLVTAAGEVAVNISSVVLDVDAAHAETMLEACTDPLCAECKPGGAPVDGAPPLPERCLRCVSGFEVSPAGLHAGENREPGLPMPAQQQLSTAAESSRRIAPSTQVNNETLACEEVVPEKSGWHRPGTRPLKQQQSWHARLPAHTGPMQASAPVPTLLPCCTLSPQAWLARLPTSGGRLS